MTPTCELDGRMPASIVYASFCSGTVGAPPATEWRHSPPGSIGAVELKTKEPGGAEGGGGGGGGGGDWGGGGGGEGGGAAGGTIPVNRASSARLMPSAVRKSAARSSPEHVSFLSPIPTHLNTSTPSTLVLNAMAVWRPAMRSSFAVAGSWGSSVSSRRRGDTAS
eukprot:scaffold2070_cov46-Phaeocystis_antarctica.AAC.1